MRFPCLIFVLALLLLGFAYSDSYNLISALRAGETVITEQPYTIEWEVGTAGPVKIELHFGDSLLVLLIGASFTSLAVYYSLAPWLNPDLPCNSFNSE